MAQLSEAGCGGRSGWLSPVLSLRRSLPEGSFDDDSGENFWLLFPASVAVCWLALAGTLPWWRKLDAMQKDAHLESWYWGGMAGGVAVLMALAVGAGIRSDLARGGGLVLVGQGVGFLIFFVVWKWQRRGPEV